MSLMMFYDTETTGLPLFREPSLDPRQPHIVQVAAALVDLETRNVVSSVDLVVKPNGWEIPPDVSDIHGITTEHAKRVGVPERVAVEVVLSLWDAAGRRRCAHNEQFDARILRIGLKRELGEFEADEWKTGETVCTANLATPLLRLPATPAMVATGRGGQMKRASLGESHLHLCGGPLENAHSAMGDVLGLIRVYWAIQDMKTDAAGA